MECRRCGGYKPDRYFYTNGPNKRMSECAECNRRRKAEAYQPKVRTNSNLGRSKSGRFVRAG